MEIGSEYLQCLHQSFIFYLAFLRQYYESRIQNSLNPSIMLLFANAEKWEVDDAFEEFFQCHLSIQDIFNQYLGENHQYVKEINYQRGINAFGYLKSVHLYYSKSASTSSDDAIYNDWLIEKVKRCLDLVKVAVDLQKLEVERYEPLFNFLPPVPSVSNNSFNEVAVSFDFSAPPTSFPQHPAGGTSSIIQPLLYIELGEMQLEYANILFFLAMLYRQYLPSSPLAGSNEILTATEEERNVIAQYLKETEENSLISLQETFFNDYIRQVTFVTNSALTNLSGTSQQFQAKLLFLISQVANSLFQQQRSSLNSIQSYRDQLQGLMKEQIDKADTDNDSLMDLFAIGCQLLIESYYQEGNTNKSAYWIFYAQGLFAKMSLTKLWRKSLMNSTAQQQNELMNCLRRISLFETFKYPNPSEFKSYEVDSAFLKSLPLPALKRVSIAADPFEVLTNIEPFYNQNIFITLHLCPLRRFVYVSVGRKINNSTVDPKTKGKDTVPTSIEEPKSFFVGKMELSEDHRRLLQTVLYQHQQWQGEINKFMALHCDSFFDNDDLLSTPTTRKNSNLATGVVSSDAVESTFQSLNTETQQNKSVHQKAERALSERFSALVSDIETIFAPLLGKSSPAFRFLSEYISSNKPTSSVVGATWHVTLLMDFSLQNLPWEALPLFEELFSGKIVRDFSLHMIGHRSGTLSSPNSSNVASTGANVSSSTIKYLIDPFNEDSGSKSTSGGVGNLKERKSVQDMWKNVLQTIPGGSKWTKLRQQNGLLSLEDFLLNLDGSNKLTGSSSWINLFTFCLGRFGSLFNPKDISITNLEKIQLFCNLDYNYNELSFRRQNSLDVTRKISEVELESPLPMIAIMSLAGINTLIMNAWSIPFIAQNRFFQGLCKGFAGNKEKLNQALSNLEKNSGGKQKPFFSYARVLYGVPSLTYSDN